MMQKFMQGQSISLVLIHEPLQIFHKKESKKKLFSNKIQIQIPSEV